MGGSDLATATGRYFAGCEDMVVDDQEPRGGGEFRQVRPALADPAQRMTVAQSSLGHLSRTASDCTDRCHVAGMNQDRRLDSPGRRDQLLQQAAGAADPRLKGLVGVGADQVVASSHGGSGSLRKPAVTRSWRTSSMVRWA
jgi:hypothetical protein